MTRGHDKRYDRVLYFVNSKQYRYHHDFCEDALRDATDLERFNTLNYSDLPERAYLLANLNYYPSAHCYGIEFTSEDTTI